MPDHLNTQFGPDQPSLKGQGPFEASGFGTLWLVWSDVGLVSLSLPQRARRVAEDGAPPTEEVPAVFAEPLQRYFVGEPVDPAELPVDLRGTRFQRKVWNALRRIPRGQVRSYAGIALDIGSPRATRAVGMANSKNPIAIVVPCHRVVEKGHRLGGYSGGLENKIYLLGLEGVRVEGDRVMPGQLDLPIDGGPPKTAGR